MRATTILSRAAYLALLAAGYAYGFLRLPEGEPGLPLADKVSAMLPWLGQAWPALFLMTSTTALAAWFVAMLVAERRAQRSRRELAKTADPALFQQTDGEQAISYLLNESVWGWRRFAGQSSGDMIPPAQYEEYEEFRRVAMTTSLRVVGLDEDRKTTLIGRGYWHDAQLYPAIGTSFGLSTTSRRNARPSTPRLTHLSVSTDDLYEQWPRASMARKVAVWLWVGMKLAWYRSTRRHAHAGGHPRNPPPVSRCWRGSPPARG
jgi:hypothetical protein